MAFGKKQKHASGEVPELGAIFMSNSATKKVCFSSKIFALPLSKAGFVEQVKAGMFLFLFEYEKRKLYGVYQACSDGAMDFSSKTFSSSGFEYPAQVQFRVLWYCKPLSEYEFRPAIKDNYFAANKFKFGLSRNQAWELLCLFSSRKLRDESLPQKILPTGPSLIHGATRSSSIDNSGEKYACRAQNEYVPENASAFELHRDLDTFLMPNREVKGRLLMDSNKDTVSEVAGTILPSLRSNYMRKSSDRDRVTHVRDIMDYGCNSINEYELKISSGSPIVPFAASDERFRINTGSVDADILLAHNKPVVGQLQRLHDDDRSIWDERIYADHIVNGRSLIKVDEVRNHAGQNHVMSGMRHVAFDSNLNSSSYYDNSIPDTGNVMAIDEFRKCSMTRYFEPRISNSKSTCPVFCDNTIDDGPGSYDHDSSTLHGWGKYHVVHHSPNFIKGSCRSMHGELSKSLSKEIPLPSETDSASILRQPVACYDPSVTINHPISSRSPHSSRRIESLGMRDYEDPLSKSAACGRTQEREIIGQSVCMNHGGPFDINQGSKVYQERQIASQNKQSVFSRLKPALNADNINGVDSEGKDAQNDINTIVNEVMEMLSGHYCQLVRSSSKTKQINDDDESKIKKQQMSQPQTTEHESAVSKKMVLDVSTDNIHRETESQRQINGEMPRVGFKRRSEVQKTRSTTESGPGEKSCSISMEKQSKRRKLVRPSLGDKKLSNEDAVLEKYSANTLSCQPLKDGQCSVDLPHPCNKEQNPPEAGDLGVLAANIRGECSDEQLSANNLIDGKAEICMISESQKHEGQNLLSPCACDVQQKPPKLCSCSSSSSAVLAASVGGVKCSGQLTLNMQEDERAVTCTALSGDHKNYEIKDYNANSGLLPEGKGDHDDGIFKKKELGQSPKDADFPVDAGGSSCSGHLSINMHADETAETCTIFNENHKEDGKVMHSNMNIGLKN